ncbi:MAG: hypothetical protein RI957_258 [Verrucomicrobiota bacterium]|jgi:hypothetical protein
MSLRIGYGFPVLTGRLIPAHGEAVGFESLTYHHCVPTGRLIGEFINCGETRTTSRIMPVESTAARRTMKRPVGTKGE